MTKAQSAPSEDLRAGRRALDAVAGCEILEDLAWNERDGTWALRLRLTADVVIHPHVPSATVWIVRLDAAYPLGTLQIHPATSGGLTKTFPHQSPNRPGRDGSSWRAGHICVDSGVRALGRHELDDEPHSARERLRWHVLGALDWLAAASRGDLLRAGEPFELPAYMSRQDGVVGFIENEGSLRVWEADTASAGLAAVAVLRDKPSIFAVRRFVTRRGVVWEPEWGQTISATRNEQVALWIRLERPPVIEPYEPPLTFENLRTALDAQGVDFDAILRRLALDIRDGRSHLVLLGFPIPAVVGGSAQQMQWQAFQLPPLARGQTTAPGFRPSAESWARHDAHNALGPKVPVQWLKTENWATHDISTRGRFDQALATAQVLLIGAGAVGSALAEVLLRGNVPRIAVADGERIVAGNLVRHTLSLGHIGLQKATALVARLNQSSPHARAVAIDSVFPPMREPDLRLVRDSTIVLDCTGADEVLHRLSSFDWSGERLFVSVSLGLHAKRLFVLVHHGNTLPVHEFTRGLQPWLEKEREALRAEGLPREGLGCWHPIAPARIDHVWLMVGLAADELNSLAARRPTKPLLIVFERTETGVHRSEHKLGG